MISRTIGLVSTNYKQEELRALADDRMVSTIPFGGRYRLVDFVLSNMVNSGITSVGLISHFNYRSLIEHVGSGKHWGLAKKDGGLFILPGSVYSARSKDARFLVRDLKSNLNFVKREDCDYIIVSDGSTVMNIDFTKFIQFHEDSGYPLTLLCKDMPERKDGKFVVEENGRVVKMVGAGMGSTSRYINCFIINKDYFLECLELFALLDYADFMEIVQDRIPNLKINSYNYDGFVGIIENIQDYVEVSRKLMDRSVRDDLFNGPRRIMTRVTDQTPTIYKPGAKVVNSLVSAGCIIEGTVENSIISRNTYIGKGAVVKNSIVMHRGNIQDGASVDHVICDTYVSIGKNVHVEGSEEKPLIFGKNSDI